MFLLISRSTHFGYTWAPSFRPRHLPYAADGDGIHLAFNEIAPRLIKNRYLNAVSYVDELLGTLFKSLSAAGVLDNMIICITGDHGEEFGDFGNYFHTSALNPAQVCTPIVFWAREIGELRKNARRVVSHVDILPTLLSFTSAASEHMGDMDGRTIFDVRERPAVVSMSNLMFTPRRFLLYSKWGAESFSSVNDQLSAGLPMMIEFDGINNSFNSFTTEPAPMAGTKAYRSALAARLAEVFDIR